MQLHRAQYGQGVVSHIGGLFHKRSAMDWEANMKVVEHKPVQGAQCWRGKLNDQDVVVFYNEACAFYGVPDGEGFRPLSPQQIQEVWQAAEEVKAKFGKDTDRTAEKNRAQAEVGRLLRQREGLSGARLAVNTRRLRELSREFNIELPLGI